jgi:hypothetical protein
VPGALEAPLAEDLHVSKKPAQKRLEVGTRELDPVKGVVGRVRRLVRLRSRNEEHAVGTKHPHHVAKEPLLVVEMLDRLERADDVERGVGRSRASRSATRYSTFGAA